MNMYAYCGNDPVGFRDPSGMIRLVFYDGREDMFREGADDDYFDYAFDISDPQGMSSTEYIIWLINNSSEWADEAEYRSIRSYIWGEGEEITDAYFMGHGHTSNLEFGLSTLAYDTPAFSNFFASLGDALDENDGADAVIHLRQCSTAQKTRGRSKALEAAVEASGHSVTGSVSTVGYYGMESMDVGIGSIPIPEAMRGPLEHNYGGPDYDYDGAVLQVSPHESGRLKYETIWYQGMTETIPMITDSSGLITEIKVAVPSPY